MLQDEFVLPPPDKCERGNETEREKDFGSLGTEEEMGHGSETYNEVKSL